MEVYNYHKNSDYERILLRRKKIETYKETSERLRMEKSQQAQAEANRKEEQRRAEEMRRLEIENAEKEKLRKQAEQVSFSRIEICIFRCTLWDNKFCANCANCNFFFHCFYISS